MTKKNNESIRQEIMDIVNLLIEEKKIVNRIEEKKVKSEKLYKEIRELNKSIEEENIKALKCHKTNLNNAGKLIISEK